MFSEGQRVEVPLSAKLIRDERTLKTPLSLMVSYFPMRLGMTWASRMTPGVMTMGLDLTFYDISLPKGINIFYLDYPTSYISNQRHKLLSTPIFFWIHWVLTVAHGLLYFCMAVVAPPHMRS